MHHARYVFFINKTAKKILNFVNLNLKFKLIITVVKTNKETKFCFLTVYSVQCTVYSGGIAVSANTDWPCSPYGPHTYIGVSGLALDYNPSNLIPP